MGLPMQEPFCPVAHQLRQHLHSRLPDATSEPVLDAAMDVHAPILAIWKARLG